MNPNINNILEREEVLDNLTEDRLRFGIKLIKGNSKQTELTKFLKRTEGVKKKK